MFESDYQGAIVLEAKNYGFQLSSGASLRNHPKGICLHTPEEPADNHASTPEYFATTDRPASTHYFVSYLGKVWQCVPEEEGAYANAVQGKPYPAWAEAGINLNLQTLSIEIEGYAASIHQTCLRGQPQWQALVALLANRCKFWNIPPSRIFGHYDVSVYRSDPGQLDIVMLRADVQAALREEDVPTPAEWATIVGQVAELVDYRKAQMQNNADQTKEYTSELARLQARIEALEASSPSEVQALLERLAAMETKALKDGDQINVHFVMRKVT